jgi:hypothetical protein
MRRARARPELAALTNGLDAGEYAYDVPYSNLAEATRT